MMNGGGRERHANSARIYDNRETARMTSEFHGGVGVSVGDSMDAPALKSIELNARIDRAENPIAARARERYVDYKFKFTPRSEN